METEDNVLTDCVRLSNKYLKYLIIYDMMRQNVKCRLLNIRHCCKMGDIVHIPEIE